MKFRRRPDKLRMIGNARSSEVRILKPNQRVGLNGTPASPRVDALSWHEISSSAVDTPIDKNTLTRELQPKTGFKMSGRLLRATLFTLWLPLLLLATLSQVFQLTYDPFWRMIGGLFLILLGLHFLLFHRHHALEHDEEMNIYATAAVGSDAALFAHRMPTHHLPFLYIASGVVLLGVGVLMIFAM